MKSFRKLLCLFCAIAMVFSLMVGCSNTPADSSDITSDTEDVVSDETPGTEDVTSDETTDVTSEEDVVVSDTVSNNAGTTSTGKKPTSSTNKAPTTSQGPLNNIPETEDEKWGTEKGTSSVKKTPAWLKQIKSGEITILCASSSKGTDKLKNQQETFKALTGKDLKVNEKIVEWNSLRSTLQTMVVSGNGPDVFGIYNGVAYYLRNKGLTRDIRDYINMNDAVWDPMKESSEVMFFKGELTGVVASTGGYGTYGHVYNKKLMKQAGLEDPWELYKQGKWNITTFLEYVEELTVDQNHDNTPEVFGVSMAPESILRMALASGEDLVKFNEDGSVTNNIRSATFTRWASYARQIQKVGSYDTESWTRATRFVQGKVAMSDQNIHTQYQNEEYAKMKKAGNIGWVPYPLDVNAKVHNYTVEYTVHFLPKNSKNPEGGAAWLYMNRYMAENPNSKKVAEEKAKFLNEYKFSQDEYDYINEKLKLPFEIKPITFNWQHLPDFNYNTLWAIFTEDWQTLVEKVNPVFDAAIKAQNK